MAIENRLSTLFENKKKDILTIYFTAGFPNKEDTLPIVEALTEAGANIIEIGMPFSDPIADGETIQQSNQQAIENGMTIQLLLEQLQGLRSITQIPVLLMGYLNPVMQFGFEKFCQIAAEVGIDGLILPDLPIQEFENIYQPIFQKHQLSNVFLITPQTSKTRIESIDKNTNGFVYAVSSASTTGKTGEISAEQIDYFKKIQSLGLKNPFQIGFGIHDASTFHTACEYASGAIIGSAFIKMLQAKGSQKSEIIRFVEGIRG
jgi:tryptophan synthase alpha chain